MPNSALAPRAFTYIYFKGKRGANPLNVRRNKIVTANNPEAMDQAKEIPLELSKENLRHLLTLALGSESGYSHFDIANWCSIHFYQIFKDDDNDIEDYNIDEATYQVLADIETNWDIHVHETRVQEPSGNIEERNIRLPHDWITNWLDQLI